MDSRRIAFTEVDKDLRMWATSPITAVLPSFSGTSVMVTVEDVDGVVFTPSGFETVSSFLTSASTFFTFFLVSGELSFLIFGWAFGGPSLLVGQSGFMWPLATIGRSEATWS
eukprot:s975_g10.t1